MNRATFATAIFFIPILAIMACQPERGRYVAIDGDTLISPHGEHIRLLYIDSPELPGHTAHCRPNCVDGDPWAAKAALQHALDSGAVRCDGDDIDRYGRTLAECFVTAPNGQTVSINEVMLATGHALPYRYRGSSRHGE